MSGSGCLFVHDGKGSRPVASWLKVSCLFADHSGICRYGRCKLADNGERVLAVQVVVDHELSGDQFRQLGTDIGQRIFMRFDRAQFFLRRADIPSKSATPVGRSLDRSVPDAFSLPLFFWQILPVWPVAEQT